MRIDGSMMNEFGTIRATYVYMLLCQDDGPLYIKIGITERPDQRLMELVNSCPVSPAVYALVGTNNRKYAQSLEGALLDGYKKWRTNGEWLALSVDDKPEFNEIWKSIFRTFQKRWPAWDAKWDKVSVPGMVKRAKARAAYYRNKFNRLGKAGKDYVRHSAKVA